MNKIILIGHVGQDPELRTLDSGNTVVSFSLATNETYKDKAGEKQTQTEWHKVEAWGNQAQVIGQYVTKGQQIAVEGKLVYDKWNDKDGNSRITAKVRLTSFHFLGSGAKETTSQERAFRAQAPAESGYADDLPF